VNRAQTSKKKRKEQWGGGEKTGTLRINKNSSLCTVRVGGGGWEEKNAGCEKDGEKPNGKLLLHWTEPKNHDNTVTGRALKLTSSKKTNVGAKRSQKAQGRGPSVGEEGEEN